jgi:serine/threonine-protein kinase RIM15
MWMVRPQVIREVTIDLPDVLVEGLGVGAEMLAHYLNGLAEAGANDPGNHPPPMPVLCRICERHITPWWFEKHTELCLQEHRAEMDVQVAQENLTEHRNAIVKVLDALEAQPRNSQPTSIDGLPPPAPIAEYKGMPVGSNSLPSSGPSSGRASPASPPAASRDRPSSGLGHHRARSFAVRRPVPRIVELILDLCDTALEINTPALKESKGPLKTELRTQSPQSENRLSQVLQWQSPTTSTIEQDQGLHALCEDTSKLSRAKVDAVLRYRRILEYSERIRVEFDVLVQECIDEAIDKAARIAAGELSDSSESSRDYHDDDETPYETAVESEGLGSRLDEGVFSGSFDEGASSMAMALRNATESGILAEALAQPSSRGPASTRSSSPRGSQTPRSHGGAMSIITHSKRASMHFESDAGAESDSSIRSFAKPGSRRGDSPNSEGVHRPSTGSRERKRRSLILPSTVSNNSRQQSPARSMMPPSSPLRMNKPRGPSVGDTVQSPITSPTLATSEFSSPVLAAQHLHHHRRQSSAAASEASRPPASPRMTAVSNPQPRAVPPSIKDFEVIKPISKGAFGSVYLSKKKSTGDYYAIKVLKKADMVAKNQVTNVKAERAIMMWQGESDFVAKLYWTFASKDFLYLVMEYLNGGDLASLIKVLGGLPEDWAMKYTAEVVLGVEHLHSRGIIHRDLKPDNLLVDPKGHLKLTDFGLSRMGLIGRQKRALNAKSDEAVPDLLKNGPFQRATSIGSSRSASFDFQGNISPQNTPSLTPALTGEHGQPSYFSLSRENSGSRDPSRRTSGYRSDSADSDALQAAFRRFSLAEDIGHHFQHRREPIEEESQSEGGAVSPDPYPLHQTVSRSSGQSNTPPPSSTMPPPPMPLFDPEDSNRKFVGTPDYLAPETINGFGQDEVSDWWSLGCILFECLYGYPPFHANTPEEVFQNILDRKIDWPDEDDFPVSEEAKDLMNQLMTIDPNTRLGANADDKFLSGGDEIKNHPWFAEINWETLREDEASFVPAPENPEDTEYFDTRGATLQHFAPEFEDQGASSSSTPGADYPERPHDALSRVRSQFNNIKRPMLPLHIPAHVRDGRNRRLSEPVAGDDFGSFAFKNLPVLEKANKDVIQKLRAEAMQAQSKPPSTIQSPSGSGGSPGPPSLESSPVLPMPLKRTMSANKGSNRSASPSLATSLSSLSNPSPSRASQPSSPLLVQFSAGQNHERRKTSSGSTSHPTSGSLQPGSFFDMPRLSTNVKTPSSAPSPIKLAKTPVAGPGEKVQTPHQRPTSMSLSSPRGRSQTMSSQDSEPVASSILANHSKRRSQVLDASPSSSDNEEKAQQALLRVHRRRQSSRRLSQLNLSDGPIFRPLDVLICEDHPVTRLVMEKLLEKLRCRTISVTNGAEAIRYAMGEIKFDIIMMEARLPQISGADVARMIRETKNANSHTPIVAVSGYLKELQAPYHFDALIDKPPNSAKLTEVMGRLCQWRTPPPNWTPKELPPLPLSALRQESTRVGDSPTSNSSGFPALPSGSYRGSSREDSISSSFFTDQDSRNDDIPVAINKNTSDEWRDKDLAHSLGGLGISEEDIEDADTKLLDPTAAMAQLIHQESAPPILESPRPMKKRSSEAITTKRRSLEAKKHESAESGDDEDEELGDKQVRTKSPKAKPKTSSKLGTEMMRTNSHGSVVSVDATCVPADLGPAAHPPTISENRFAEEQAVEMPLDDDCPEGPQVSVTPPEVFSPEPEEQIEVEPEVTTPKPLTTPENQDPDPTPRATGTPLRPE